MDELFDEFNDGRVQFAMLKVKDANTQLGKNVFIAWVNYSISTTSISGGLFHVGILIFLYVILRLVRRRCARIRQGELPQSFVARLEELVYGE